MFSAESNEETNFEAPAFVLKAFSLANHIFEFVILWEKSNWMTKFEVEIVTTLNEVWKFVICFSEQGEDWFKSCTEHFD